MSRLVKNISKEDLRTQIDSLVYIIQLMLQSLLIKFSENQGVWSCAVVNEREKYFLEKAA